MLKPLFATLAFGVLCWVPCSAVTAQDSNPAAASPKVQPGDLAVDKVMESDPAFVIPEVTRKFPEHLLETWIKALDLEEVDLKRQIVESLIRAHSLGVSDLDAAIPHLAKLIQSQPTHPVLELAVVRALVAFDARQYAELLFERAQASGGSVAHVVEPALARWEYVPAREVWRERIESARGSSRSRKRALECLGTVRDDQFAAPLAKIVMDPSETAALRIAAARSLASIRRSGLEPQSASLAVDKSPAAIENRILAATLLQHHQSAAAQAELLELATDAEPVVVGLALTGLLQIDPQLIVPLAPELVKNPDSKVRQLTAQALVEVPAVENVALLGPLLDDVHPGLRRYVARSLFALAEDEKLTESVIDASMKVMAGDGWRGYEQALLLLTYLDHKPVASRALELLQHQRPEVLITAAWALRKLALPDTLPALLERAEKVHDRYTNKLTEDEFPVAHLSHSAMDQQVSQIFQCFGELRYVPGEEVMRAHVPKGSGIGLDSRRAAIWALGHFHENEPDADLTQALISRLTDENPFSPEDDGVRRYSAISLGRMMATNATESLMRYYHGSSEIELGARWAYERITGKQPPPLQVPVAYYTDWVLTPLSQ